ncbi:MAG: cation diffusion facilitator family transporter [Bacteroidota bacterium]|nr:cation diffusion facilitator family transporter [Cytophagales bacterium]
MQESHNHSHTHALPSQVSQFFVIGIGLNLAFVVFQIIVGLKVHSLALLSDAGHNFADVGTLALSLLAFRLLRVKSNKHYTYGYKKTSVLTALFNAMVLMVSIGAILYEAAHRFLNPETLPGLTIAWVAMIGVAVNGLSAWLFFKEKEMDLNVKSAFMHLMADALLSLSVAAGGIVIYVTHWYWIDSALSIIVAIVILITTWKLLKDSVRLSLDGVPIAIDFDDVRATVLNTPGVKDLHHLHIWAISTTENALTAHVVLDKLLTRSEQYLAIRELKHRLHHKQIQHVTVETELEGELCEGVPC